MQTQFNLKNGKNRALVFYIVPDSPNYSAPTDVEEIVESVFADAGIEPDEASAATLYRFAETKDFLNIALRYGETSKRLKVGGTFDDVCVGVYFYDRPVQPEPDPDADPDEESEPAPSITSLVCNALQEAFPDVIDGASSFVINPDLIDFELEIE